DISGYCSEHSVVPPCRVVFPSALPPVCRALQLRHRQSSLSGLPRSHPLAPHHGETNVNPLPLVVKADAAKVEDPAKAHVSTDERLDVTRLHKLVTVEVGPEFMFSPLPILAEPVIKVAGDADQAERVRIESQHFPDDPLP